MASWDRFSLAGAEPGTSTLPRKEHLLSASARACVSMGLWTVIKPLLDLLLELELA